MLPRSVDWVFEDREKKGRLMYFSDLSFAQTFLKPRKPCLLLLSALIFGPSFSGIALGQGIQLNGSYPSHPPNPCYEGCTPEMHRLSEQFNQMKTGVSLVPAVYSGTCHYLSKDYNGKTDHYAVVMIDQLKNQGFYFSTIFAFFLPENEFAKWDLHESRKQMADSWKENGKIIDEDGVSRVELIFPNAAPWIYWLRQDTETKEIAYISYLGGTYLKAFCLLKPNENQ